MATQGTATKRTKISGKDEVSKDKDDEDSWHPGWGIPIISAVVMLSVLVSLNHYFSLKEKEIVNDSKADQLVHVVQEIRGFEKHNLIGLVVMLLTGGGILLATIVYRRERVNVAAEHDAVFWMLASFALVLGVIHTIQRMRQEKHKTLIPTPNQASKLAVYGVPAVIVAGLLLYRRKLHAKHLARKKRQRKY